MASKHLTKEVELELGGKIQAMISAKDKLSESNNPEDIANLNLIIEDGKQALDKLINANTGLVYDRARIFKSKFPAAPDLEDLIQEGMTGLVTAAYKFDPNLENKFSTVAFYWVSQAIGRGTNKNGRLVRLPENRIADFMKMSKISNRYESHDLSQAQLDEKIKQETKLSSVEIADIRAAALTPASLNKVISSENGSTKELIDFVGEDNAQEAAEDNFLKTEMSSILMDIMNSLTEVERNVIASSFSMDGIVDEVLTPKLVREKYSLPPSRFKKILNNSLVKIKMELKDYDVSFTDFIE